MNKTKKITTGAMLLAIVGAIMEIDKRLAMFLFSDIIVLMIAAVIVVYAAMYTFKDGVLLAACLLVISLILGDIAIISYYPISCITGIAYSYFMHKNFSQRNLLLVAIIFFVLGELIVAFVLGPLLFNISIADQVSAFSTEISQMLQASGVMNDPNMAAAYNQILSGNKLLLILAISTIVIGLMEGVCIHLIIIFILKRFKIKDITVKSALNSKPKASVAYLSFLAFAVGNFCGNKIENETYSAIALVLFLIGSMVLMYYGYIAIISFGAKVLHKRLMLLSILMIIMPGFWVFDILIGFLYASGPLYNFINKER